MTGRRCFLAPLAGLALCSVNVLEAAPIDAAVRAEMEAQARHIDSLRKAVSSLQERQFEIAERVTRLETLRSEVAKLTDRTAQLRSEVGSLQSEVSGLNTSFADYQKHYRKAVRFDAVGEKFSTLMANGKVYQEVVIRRVTDTGLDIRHAGGATRLQHNQLPADFRDRFQWDSGVADLAMAQEAKEELLREHLIAIAVRQEEQKKEETLRTAATEKRFRDLERRIATATSNSSRLQSSGKLGERRMVGNGGSSSSRYRYSRSRYSSRPTIYYRPTYRSVSRPPTVRQVSRVVPRPRPRPAPTPRVCPNGRD